jgi:hypothetical protein
VPKFKDKNTGRRWWDRGGGGLEAKLHKNEFNLKDNMHVRSLSIFLICRNFHFRQSVTRAIKGSKSKLKS